MKRGLIIASVLFLLLGIQKTANAQPNVLNPNDPNVIYTSSSHPATPAFNSPIIKWGHMQKLPWDTYAAGYRCYNLAGVSFRVKFPKSYQHNVADGKTYPLFVFFHGAGEAGPVYDDDYQLLHGGQTHAANVDNGVYDGFLVYPQSTTTYSQGIFPQVANFIDSMIKYVKVDQDRVIASGLSNGGQACWDFMNAYNRKVAGGLPISAAFNNYLNYFPNIVTVPIWIANGGLDGNPAPYTASYVIDSFKRYGGYIRQFFYPNLGHSVWNTFWAEPDYFPYLSTIHKANPLVYYQRYQYCPNESFIARLAVQSGFFAYEWDKDGATIPGATSNELNVSSYGTYRARFKRTSTSAWSAWSPAPAVISAKQATVTPPIQIDGMRSNVLPAPDGSTTVPLMIPNTFATYEWRRISDNALVSTTNKYVAAVGQYKLKVTEQFGCSSDFSLPYSVINANGANGPDAATSLSAVATGNTSIQLDWNDNPTPAFNETAFEIYRSTTSGSNYTLVAVKGADVLTHTDQNLATNTKYYYVIRAINNNGASPLSTEVSATTKADVSAPTAPTNLAVTFTTRTSVSLSWDPSSDDVGVSKYDLYVNGSKLYTTSNTTFTANNLTGLQIYSFYVKARDLAGNVSPASNQVSASTILQGLSSKYYETGLLSALPDFAEMTPIKTEMVSNVSLTPRLRNDNFAFLWEGYIKIPATGSYLFETNSNEGSKLYIGPYNHFATALVDNDGRHNAQYRSGTITLNAGVYPIAITFFERTGAESMNIYWTSAAAGINVRTAIPNSAFSDNAISFGTLPTAPGNLNGSSPAYNRVNLTWSDNSNNETGFEVVRSTTQNGTYSPIGTVATGVASFTDSVGLSANTTFWYKVRAINQAGQSAFSTAKSVTTQNLPAAPNAPSGLVTQGLSTSSIQLSFTDNSANETGFEIYRSVNNTSTYRSIAVLAAGSSSPRTYVDGSLFPNTNYYYKVRALGTGGSNSNFTADVLGKTLNSNPVINKVSSFTMKYGTSKTLAFAATDADADPLVFTVLNLPAFASFTDNGNGTASLQLNPAITDQAAYNLSVIATDINSGADTTAFTLTVNSNSVPVATAVADQSMNEGDSLTIALSANDSDGNTGLTWALTSVPGFATIQDNNDGTASLKLKPNFAGAGSYKLTLTVSDALGAKDQVTFNLNVADFTPVTETILTSMVYNSPFAPAPWNNITGVSTSNLLNTNGQATSVGLQFLGTPWNAGNAGAVTGNNSGVYPDAVIRDYFWFGAYGAPETVDVNITGLTVGTKYNITLFGSSAWTGLGNNGTTVYTINGTQKPLYIDNNQQNTVTFSGVVPNGSGIITVNMSKGASTPYGAVNAIVIDRPFDDGTAPILPTNLAAQALADGTVKLTWKDLAYNEANYLVYRSTSPSGPFTTPLNPGAANANDTSYIDNTVASNLTYYYKIAATNTNGSSGQTAAVSATTLNKAPVLAVIADVAVKGGASLQVNTNATDDAGDILTTTVSNLPSFATYQNLGNGTGRITFSPSVTDLGVYKNVIVKVTDNNGASAADTFNVRVIDSSLRQVYVNFSASVSEGGVAAPAPWNNWLSYPYANQPINNLVDDAGANSGFNVSLLQQWDGNLGYGMITGNNSGIYPDAVMKTCIHTTSTSARTIQIGGLNPAKRYNIVVFSSHNAGPAFNFTYTSGAQTLTGNAAYNSNKSIQVNGLTPSAGGTVQVTLTKDAAATYLNLNAMIIQEYNASNLLQRPYDLFAETQLDSSSVKLTWSDRSSTETGFQVYRATSLNGAYTLVTTTAANATTYTVTGLTGNTKYYFKVRAANGGSTFSNYSNVATAIPASRTVLVNFNANTPQHAPSPWNSTDGPSVEGATWDNLQDNTLFNSGISLTITKEFNGPGFTGSTAAGIFPTQVIQSNYWTDAGQVSEVKFTNLNVSKKYRIGVFGSAVAFGYFFANYTCNGQMRQLNSYNNSTKLVYFESVTPVDGEIVISVTPEAGNPYVFTGAFTIEAFDDADGYVATPLNRTVQPEEPLISQNNVTPKEEVRKPAETNKQAAVISTEVKVFPNPFNDRITIEGIAGTTSTVTAVIFDLQGRAIYRNVFSGGFSSKQTLNINIPNATSLKAGTYILNLYLDGSLSKTVKLIKLL